MYSHNVDIPLIQGISDPNFINEYISATILVARFNADFTILEANDEYFNLVGYSKEEVRNIYKNKGFSTLHPEDRDLTLEIFTQQITNNPDSIFDVQCRLVNKDVGYKHVNFSGRIIVNDHGESICYFLLTDISGHTELLKELNKEQEFNERISNFLDNSFFDLDLTNNVMKFSKDFAQKLGIPTVLDNYPQSFIDTGHIVPNCIPSFRSYFTKSLVDEHEGEFHFTSLDNKDLWYLFSYKTLRDEQGSPIRLVGKMTDVTKQRLVISELTYKANTDQLTDLYNKNTTKHIIERYIDISKPFNDKHAFMIIDIDNFKEINDTFGHRYGDDVLKEMATFLSEPLRHDDIIGRIGGDEFVVFLKSYHSIDDVYSKAKTISKKLNKTFTKNGKSVSVSSSIGISLYPDNGETFDILYDRSDIALYRVKDKGKNSYCFYQEQELLCTDLLSET